MPRLKEGVSAVYGIEAAVIVLACTVSLVLLWSAPWWMRLLNSLVSRFAGQLDRVDEVTDEDLHVFPKEEK